MSTVGGLGGTVCKWCNAPIKFEVDQNETNPRLDAYGNRKRSAFELDMRTGTVTKRHRCPKYNPAGTTTITATAGLGSSSLIPPSDKHRLCKQGCGNMIYFTEDDKSASGKFIPHNVSNGERHNCPNSDWMNRRK